ncbi:hypothetical protein A7U60_g4604 [Sanghuangporus baumii]|uniref:Protein kinase domain-containing protein n=1 Tax=Sanghuangporus baumii TaxID=108892 RepID=A0A9Q5HYG7_SANBA|nr:hypothetical protein A7U60_g4604 [Sanghuangporus baumii]
MGTSSESRANASPLLSAEIAWRDRYEMLESHGYRLRPRYHPNWRPSWLDTKKPVSHHEDYNIHNNLFNMDAIRVSDGQKVFLKRVRTGSREIDILRFLSEPERLQDSNNHAAALLDVFADDNDPRFSYMVMPLLRPYYYPDFYSVDEVVEFMRQLLQAGYTTASRQSLTANDRDCSELNLMMDAEAMYPKGFHPATYTMDASGYNRAYPKRRRDVKDLRYYFIDFGISSIFGPDEPRKVLGVDGQDDEVPELSIDVPYDPFLVDVFILGNLFKKAFLNRYTNLDFLLPLVERMTTRDCRERLTSFSALRLFDVLVSNQSWYTLRTWDP